MRCIAGFTDCSHPVIFLLNVTKLRRMSVLNSCCVQEGWIRVANKILPHRRRGTSSEDEAKSTFARFQSITV